MKGTLPQWICAVGILICVAILATHWQGFDPVWLTAVSTAVLVITAIFGLIGILLPYQQAAARVRSTHLKKLVAGVFDPMMADLEANYHSIVTRKALPLEWIYGHGLRIRHRRQNYGLLSTARDSIIPSGAKRVQYLDAANNHYPSVVIKYEGFKIDFETFLTKTLKQAEALIPEIKRDCHLREMDFERDASLGCFFGSVAEYVFNVSWVSGFAIALTVERNTAATAEVWVLKEGGIKDLARGTKSDMEALLGIIQKLNSSIDRRVFTKDAGDILERYDWLQRQIETIQTTGKLEGECSETE